MRKHIFKTSNIFCIKKRHVRVLVIGIKTNIYIFVTLHQKTRYSKYEIDIFASDLAGHKKGAVTV